MFHCIWGTLKLSISQPKKVYFSDPINIYSSLKQANTFKGTLCFYLLLLGGVWFCLYSWNKQATDPPIPLYRAPNSCQQWAEWYICALNYLDHHLCIFNAAVSFFPFMALWNTTVSSAHLNHFSLFGARSWLSRNSLWLWGHSTGLGCVPAAST